jgi:hypothetical protein
MQESGIRRNLKHIKDPMLEALYEIHNALGHPSNEDLGRFLQSGGCLSQAIKTTNHLFCTTRERRYPKKQRVASLHAPHQFNNIIGIDCFDSRHWWKKHQVFVSVVEWATGFMQLFLSMVKLLITHGVHTDTTG